MESVENYDIKNQGFKVVKARESTNSLSFRTYTPFTVDWPFSPAWAAKAIAKSETILKLDCGWDGRRASRVSPSHVVDAFRILSLVVSDATPSPSIVPTLHSGIQVEWHVGGLNVEFSVDDRGFSVFAYDDAETCEIEECGNEALNTLKTWVRQLRQVRILGVQTPQTSADLTGSRAPSRTFFV